MEPIISLSLAFKCPKAFSELQPCGGGWYCDSCHKMVHDFRGMDEPAIRNKFEKNGGSLCGMFDADRIRVTAPLPKWRKWLSAAVMAMGFTGLYHAASAQARDNIHTKDPKTAVENTNAIFGVAQTSAEFPGGIEKFFKYVAANLVPDASCKPGVKAFLTFIVETDGRLTDIKIMRSVFSKNMDEQMIRMFKNSPRWKPGSQNGHLVRQQYTVPVTPVAAAALTK